MLFNETWCNVACCQTTLPTGLLCLCFRFHNAADEKVIGHNVVTPICDDVQLSVDEYRTKLYDVSKIFVYLSLWFGDV